MGRIKILTDEKVKEIKELRKVYTLSQVAKVLKISRGSVCDATRLPKPVVEKKEGVFDWKDYNNSII